MMADYGKIEYFVIDVDGTMTDAGIYYDDSGNELKKFCTKDAAGFFTAHAVGMKIIVLTSHPSALRHNIQCFDSFWLHGCPHKAPDEIFPFLYACQRGRRIYFVQRFFIRLSNGKQKLRRTFKGK